MSRLDFAVYERVAEDLPCALEVVSSAKEPQVIDCRWAAPGKEDLMIQLELVV